MTIISDFDPETRRRRYMNLAREATRFASAFRRAEMREACLTIARSWLQLASDVPRERKSDESEAVPSRR